MRKAGMLAGKGLVLGRTFKGALIRLPDYCHVLVCGGTGSGKGVSMIIPNLLRMVSRFDHLLRHKRGPLRDDGKAAGREG